MTNTENIKNDSAVLIKEASLDRDKAEEKESFAEAPVTAANSRYSLKYALERIEKIADETAHIHEALAAIASMESEPTIENGGSADEMAKATAEIVRCREATNQKLIAFYEKMADDCKPQSEAQQRTQFLNWVRDCVREADHRVGLPDFEEMAALYKSL